MVVVDEDTVVSGSGDNTLRVWRLSDGTCQRVMKGHTGALR